MSKALLKRGKPGPGDAEALVDQLQEAKEAYYAGAPVMTDQAFDALEDQLRALDPRHPYFKQVGATEGNTKTKLRHVVPMLSAGKAKSAEEAWAWLEKIGQAGRRVVIEPKIDGLSATVRYQDGRLAYVATRGDGLVGQDISHVAKYVQGIPQRVARRGTFEVRGELYIPKASQVPNPEGKPLRNLAVGFINRKDHDLDDLRHIHFGAYQLVEEALDLGSEMDVVGPGGILAKLGVPVVQVSNASTAEELAAVYRRYLDSERDAWPYETDGLILVVDDRGQWAAIDALYEVRHHHHYNLALKPPSEARTTVLQGIEWNVSKQGKVIPVALLKPVVIGGATISRCTLNNYANVHALKMEPGDQVKVERANDVIPYLAENLSAASDPDRTVAHPDLLPKACPACSGALAVEELHLVCRNLACEEQQVLKVLHWVTCCDMQAMGEGSVRALFKAGKVKRVPDLYGLRAGDFEGVEGFGPAKTKNALEQIDATRQMNIRQFVDRLSIELVGERAMEKLGIKTVEELLDFKDGTYVVGRNLLAYLKDNRAYVEELLQAVEIIPVAVAAEGGRLVCMTGTGPASRAVLAQKIAEKGDTFVDRVTKDTVLLICEDPAGTSSKLEKARKLGVKLVSYGEYFEED